MRKLTSTVVTFRRLLFCTIAILAPLQFSFAHDFWIEPDRFSPEPGDQVEIRLRQGMAFKGDTLPYINEWFLDFSRVTADGREDVISIPGDDPAARLPAPDGAMLIGYLSKRAFTELPAEKFNRYLEDEGIEFVRQLRIDADEDELPAPEYFVRCAKALVQSGEPGEDVYATELGYRLELIPVTDPYAATPGDSLTFRLLYRGEPAADFLVQAFTRELPESIQRIRTDENGLATIELDSAGVWLIKAVSIQPLVGVPKAKWLSHWASFLFELEG